jgi:hypothetical protein
LNNIKYYFQGYCLFTYMCIIKYTQSDFWTCYVINNGTKIRGYTKNTNQSKTYRKLTFFTKHDICFEDTAEIKIICYFFFILKTFLSLQRLGRSSPRCPIDCDNDHHQKTEQHKNQQMRTSFPVDPQTRTLVIYIYHYTPQRNYESPHQQCCPTVHTRLYGVHVCVCVRAYTIVTGLIRYTRVDEDGKKDILKKTTKRRRKGEGKMRLKNLQLRQRVQV